MLTLTNARLVVVDPRDPTLDRAGDLQIAGPTGADDTTPDESLDVSGAIVTPGSSTRTTTCCSRRSARCPEPAACR